MLSEDIRKVLAIVSIDPKYYPPLHDAEANAVVSDVVSKFTKLALIRETDSRVAATLDDVLWPEYRKRIVIAYYYLTRELKLERKLAEELLMGALEKLAGLAGAQRLSPVRQVIIDTLVEIIDGEETYAPYPLSLLEYASELNLIYWDGEKWNLTELGKFMLRLPPLELAKALLTLEMLLSRASPNCMTREFLERLKEVFSGIPEGEAVSVWEVAENLASEMELPQFPHLITHSWLYRLARLGVVTLKFDKLSANELTLQFLSLVLDPSSNPYHSVLSSLAFRSDPPLVTTNVPERIRELANHPLVSGSWSEVEQALNSYSRGDYHAALRTVLPIIERILREIAVREGLAGTERGLNTLVEVVKGRKLVSARTENLIKALGRDAELHGLEQMDLDRARFYAELALMTLLELVRDYERHKLLHRAVREISQELGLSPEELIKAYPDDRRTIHVQFLSDGRLRIIVKGQHVYEAAVDREGKLVYRKVALEK